MDSRLSVALSLTPRPTYTAGPSSSPSHIVIIIMASFSSSIVIMIMASSCSHGTLTVVFSWSNFCSAVNMSLVLRLLLLASSDGREVLGARHVVDLLVGGDDGVYRGLLHLPHPLQLLGLLPPLLHTDIFRVGVTAVDIGNVVVMLDVRLPGSSLVRVLDVVATLALLDLPPPQPAHLALLPTEGQRQLFPLPPLPLLSLLLLPGLETRLLLDPLVLLLTGVFPLLERGLEETG